MENVSQAQVIYDAFARGFLSLLIFIVIALGITLYFKQMNKWTEGIFGLLLLAVGATMSEVIFRVSEGAVPSSLTVIAPFVAFTVGGYLLGNSINRFRNEKK